MRYLVICVLMVGELLGAGGCAAHKPAAPEDVAAWSRQHFSACLLQEVQDRTLRFEGGDGSSFETAIVVVGAMGEADGVPAEYLYITQKHGIGGKDWSRGMQALHERNGRHFDVIAVNVAGEWSSRQYHFDITDFIGKDAQCFGYTEPNTGR